VPKILPQDFMHFTQENGLPSNKVYMLTLDKNGFIWCATDKGIAMYNGERFTTYSTVNGLPLNDVWKIYSDTGGKVWYFARSSELGYIENGRVYKFPTEDGNIMNPTHFMFWNNSIASFNLFRGYFLYKNMWKSYGLDTKTMDRIERGEFNLMPYYCNPLLNIFVVYDGKTFIHYDNHLNKVREIPYVDSEWVHPFYGEQMFVNETFYVLVKQTLHIYNLKTGSLEHVKLLSKEVKNLNLIAEDGQVYLNGNVGKFKLIKDQLKMIIPPIKEVEDIAYGYFNDSIGNTWVNTYNDGILRFSERANISKSFVNNNVQKLCMFKNKIYLGIENKGCFEVNKNGESRSIISGTDLFFYQIDVMSNGELRFVTHLNIYHYNNGKYKSIVYPYNSSTISSGKVLFNDGKRILVPLSNGLRVVINDTVSKSHWASGIYSIEKYQDHILLGTTDGIKIFFNDSIYNTPYLNKIFVKKLSKIHNDLLIGTDGHGFYVYKDSLVQVKGTEEFSVNNIFVAGDSAVWLSTNFGVHEIICRNNHYMLNRSILKSHGLNSNIVNDLAIVHDTLYCATDNGFCFFKLDGLKLNHQPNIILTSILANDFTFYPDQKIVILNRDNNTINFNFDIAYLNEHSQLRNTYLIEPLDQEWKPLISNNLTIEGLKPGKYNIHIRTKGFNENTDEKVISFEIKPRWFEQAGFIISVVVVAIISLLIGGYLIVSTIVQRRNKRLTLENQLVNLELDALRSKLNPHFIFNTFNSIQLYINNNQLELSEKYLILLSKHIRNVFEFSHLQKISLEKEISLLRDYLEIEKTRFGEKINIEVVVDPRINLTNNYIPSMIVQPYVENSMVHGLFHKEGIGHLTVQFNYLNNTSYEVKIIDDGIGFSSIESDRISSTKVNTERIKLINQGGDFHIDVKKSFLDESKKDRGTVITIIVKHE
jgi:hypothetical protein